MNEYDNYYITTVDDMLSGMIGNMYDDELDDELKLFSRYARQLKVKDYSKLIVLIDSTGEFYDVTYHCEPERICTVVDTPFVYDERNGNTFFYFKTESDCYDFIDKHIYGDNLLEESVNDDIIDYEILQLKDEYRHDFGFMGYNMMQRYLKKSYGENAEITLDMYNIVYDGSLLRKGRKNDYQILDSIYEIFNIHKPNNFRGHSLSVGDIVVLNGKAYYCDDIGWKEL